ncbi:KH domain-containing protein [Schleiferilactobacillus perolens]|uniref:KH domain-containing protein n=1 Tax=Schleiferilactobacillus perolens TaxID=100468 RepID=UPI00070BA749|nr:KH domain-containing protein [Schleiferilactobacillus perolens]MCI1893087.1 KH domain-containing protein [Schleiferilactobacillus harbinensis]MCI1911749.1 KH domain-containing protein [Schleiferilactobacillus harbinensis]MCI2172319.1 KH domain-containing protein [Schleiferilactobacillus perolens]
MVDIEHLICSLVTPLVNEPDSIQITRRETDNFMEFDLRVDDADVGRVIGKQGRIAQAIRTIVYSVRSPYTKRVRLNIVDQNS